VKVQTVLAVATLLLAGCAQKNDTPEAIKQGVLRDISKTFNVANMDVTVDSVAFRDKEADATVTFSLKGGSRGQGMTMQYVMERGGDSQWHIKSRASGHGADGGSGSAAAMPTGHPAMGGPAAAPAASGSKLNLPPDHPDIGTSR
jgi:hypothetical protein